MFFQIDCFHGVFHCFHDGGFEGVPRFGMREVTSSDLISKGFSFLFHLFDLFLVVSVHREVYTEGFTCFSGINSFEVLAFS